MSTGDDSGTVTVDLNAPRSIHIVGIGGAGMSAIAEILVGTGHEVSGSDLGRSAALDRLVASGVAIALGHSEANVGPVDVVAHSTAIPVDNPELVVARDRGIPVLRRADILTAITRAWKTVSVAGTHGKTTTSAMLTTALRGSGFDPAFIVGGDLRDLGRGAAVGQGPHLVVEADESDGTFVELDSHAVIVTNVEPDHLEHYGGFEGLEEAFVRFVRQAEGPCVVCLDDPGSASLAKLTSAITYGTSTDADWRIIDPAPTPRGITVSIEGPEGAATLRLGQPGMHNARNATAALVMAVALGAELELAADALSNFGGVGRRFEERGSAAGVRLVDDYAHLPTEVEAALAAARSLKPGRIVAIFQPHRYSRTEQLWSTFADSFTEADVLLVTGIYSSGEKPRGGITGELVAGAVSEAHPAADVRYVETLDEVVASLGIELRAGDLCLTLGAGDLTTIPPQVLEELETRSP
ncbi:MAG: UDP-N-acetylmuramate--L-alanine ligase [Actinomycetia bacterium]|nr:UDP-N-acetylmuramate--L-alanine ligase [Actinomycetes bacterium]MCP4227312.1 UDP-N-acetylmuramate--L-alanine ligase [Actinomycetes bacterium]MCP5034360.1 UDP-N-acetylmuramate--L-alanine ligase [Actinomycetes bacterium]